GEHRRCPRVRRVRRTTRARRQEVGRDRSQAPARREDLHRRGPQAHFPTHRRRGRQAWRRAARMTVAATELVSLTNGVLTAQINPLGAELWSLTDGVGREYMSHADPAFWTGSAPLLFPVVGALSGWRYRLSEAVYELPKHGFARHS